MEWRLGSQLSDNAKEHVLLAYIYRSTGDHRPPGDPEPPKNSVKIQFKDDQDWLANTRFAVTKAGHLDLRIQHCESTPTQ